MPNVIPYHLDRVLDSFYGLTTSTAGTSGYRMMHNYAQYSNENAYTIEAPLVGVTKEELSIKVEGNRLVVKAVPTVKSRFATAFNQEWYLNDDADVSAISANLANGLLTLTVPKVKPVSRSVNITVQ